MKNCNQPAQIKHNNRAGKENVLVLKNILPLWRQKCYVSVIGTFPMVHPVASVPIYVECGLPVRLSWWDICSVRLKVNGVLLKFLLHFIFEAMASMFWII